MKLRSGRRIVRRKNIYLPTEVWVDIFCFAWITRKLMAQMVDKIGNRWFAEQLQFYLHEWGKHTLRELYCSRLTHYIEFPQTAMPENIKYFESIRIYHFNNQIFNFLRRIQSVLTADTKLEICFIHKMTYPMNYDRINTRDLPEQIQNVRFILRHLLPLIDGVHTLRTDDRMLPMVKTSMREKFNSVKVLDVKFTRFVQSAIEPIMEWLATTNNNGPKLLQLFCVKQEIAQQTLETIRKQFMEATESSTFVLLFVTHNYELLEFNCENVIGEQLYGMRKGPWKFQVLRHQANAEAGDQLREWLKEKREEEFGVNKEKRRIQFVKPGIRHERIFAMPNLDEADNGEKEDDEDEKPSTSKKRRI